MTSILELDDTHLKAYEILPTAVLISDSEASSESPFYYLWGNSQGVKISGFSNMDALLSHPFSFTGNFQAYIQSSLLKAKALGESEIVVSRFTDSETYTTSFCIKPAIFSGREVCVWFQTHFRSESLTELVYASTAMRYVETPVWMFELSGSIVFQNPSAIKLFADKAAENMQDVLQYFTHQDGSTISLHEVTNRESKVTCLVRSPQGPRHVQIEVHETIHPETNAKVFILKAEDVEEINQKKRLLQLRLAEASTILNTIRAGIITLSGKSEVGSAYSRFTNEIFDVANISGQNFFQVLVSSGGLTDEAARRANEAINTIINQDDFTFTLNAHDLPSRVKLQSKKEIEIDWAPVLNEDDRVIEIVALLRDITDQVEAIDNIKERDLEITLLVDVLSCGLPTFTEFSDSLMSAITPLLQTEGNHSDRALLDRVHLLKGTARQIGLEKFAIALHSLEESFVANKIDEVKLQILKMIEDLQLYSNIVRKHIGPTEYIQASERNLVEFLKTQSLSDVLNSNPSFLQDFASLMVKMRYVSIGRVITSSTTNLEEFSSALAITAPEVSVSHSDLLIDVNLQQFLTQLSIQLLKNSLSHGIERDEERISKGKISRGTVYFVAKPLGKSGVTIDFWDDGRGLRVREIRMKMGISEEISDMDLANRMFQTQVSTANAVTEISGRGIGLQAMHRAVESKGGNISFQFTGPADSFGCRPFKIIIKLFDGILASSSPPFFSAVL